MAAPFGTGTGGGGGAVTAVGAGAAVPSSRREPAAWVGAVKTGLIGGVVVVFLALVGMVEAFTKRSIVAGFLDLSQIVWMGAILVTGMSAARSASRAADAVSGTGARLGTSPGTAPGAALGSVPRQRIAPAMALGAAAGAPAAAVVAVLVGLGRRYELSAVLDKARPALFDLLSLQGWLTAASARASEAGLPLEIDPGAAWLPALLVLGAVLGALGGALGALPPAWRSAIQRGLLTVVVLGTMQDLLKKTDWIRNVPAIQDGVYDRLFERKGMSIEGALFVLLLTVALSAAWPRARRAWDAWLAGPAATGGPGGPATGRDAAAPGALRRARWVRRAAIAAAGLFLIWFPIGFGTLWADVIDTVGIYILMGLGLNIVVGFAGLLDLGYVAFFAIGAYTVGVLTSTSGGLGTGLGFWLALPVAVIVGITAGGILGVPVLKTHGDYLAIITLGFGEIIRILAISDVLKPIMGGAQGITGIPKPFEIGSVSLPLLGEQALSSQQALYYLILALCALAVYITWRLRASRLGRAWMAVREDEHVAEAMGINLVSTKLLAFATGAAFASVGGAMFAVKLQSIYPASFNLIVSINVLVLIIVGGMASVPGVFVGALALVGLPELLREFEDFRMLMYGAVLVFMMLRRPEGLWPAPIIQRELHAGAARSAPGSDSGSGSGPGSGRGSGPGFGSGSGAGSTPGTRAGSGSGPGPGPGPGDDAGAAPGESGR